jgi:uncharacterized protein (TIGR02996 family)
MTESDAFLSAIADRPDDDLPRLVYADWLDEHGDPDRAEFIRVQIEHARLPLNDPRRAELLVRERALLAEHRDAWKMPQIPGVAQLFQRGFVDQLDTTGAWLLAHQQTLLAAPMVRELKIRNASSAGMDLAALPGLERIVHLDLTNTLSGPEFIPAFLAAAPLNSLRALTLAGCGFYTWAVPPLLEVERLRQLRRLDLWGNPFGDEGAALIAGSPHLANLTALNLSAHEQQFVDCLHAAGAQALADTPHLTRLRVLDLSDHYIGDAGLIDLVNSPNARSLERLAVAYNEIGELGDSGIEAVVGSANLSNLKELGFGGNKLSPLGAEALAAWPHLEHMRFVDLRECDLGETTLAKLRASPWADRFWLSGAGVSG